MQAESIDHVNLRVPESAVDDFVAFYRDHPGFDLEYYDAYQSGERGFFYVRLGESCIVHVSPRESVPEPTGENFTHFAVLVDEPLSAVTDRLDDAGVDVETEAVRPTDRTDGPVAARAPETLFLRVQRQSVSI
jgi:catechol 2,3-dioxygenase-like lactoylglutathione lyase family enzyme